MFFTRVEWSNERAALDFGAALPFADEFTASVDGSEEMSASLNFEELSFVDGYGDLAWRSLPYPEVFVHRVTDVSD